MKALWIFVAVLLVALIGYVILAETEPAPTPTETIDLDAAPTDASGADAGVTTVTYTASGFSPEDITVPAGTTVTWVNQSGDRMWIGSDEHPTHTSYDGTSIREHCVDGAPVSTATFDQCAAGDTYSFTFTRTGTFPYHNHADARAHGTVTVTQ